MCRVVDVRVIVRAVSIIQCVKAGHCLLYRGKKKSLPRTGIFFFSTIISGNGAIVRGRKEESIITSLYHRFAV